MNDASLWSQRPEEAKRLVGESRLIKGLLLPYRELQRRLADVAELFGEVEADRDAELFQELSDELLKVEEGVAALQLQRMLSGELDPNNCFLRINSGAGGTESCDWALMLMRMYERWATKKGWKVELLDFVEGEVAGVKSCLFKFSGAFAYGYAKAEQGVHRLVRISPFDSNGRRHTSFASVEVLPELGDEVQLEVRPDEIRVDTFRSSGAGGQHVNTTDSAVRMTHLPTGLVVSCQSERSQIQNRETCLQMLRAKLYEQQLEERQAKLKEAAGEKREIAWGSQIRNYVFHPYTMVKDSRTKVETSQVQAVMDGDLDLFVNSYLMQFGGT